MWWTWGTRMAQPASATLATLKHRVADDETAEAAQEAWPVSPAQRTLYEVAGAGSVTRRKTAVIWFVSALTSKLPTCDVPGIRQIRRHLRVARAHGRRSRPWPMDAPDRKGQVSVAGEDANVQPAGRCKVA